MADINKLASKLFRWEGGFVNDPSDRGGATNMGVTIATWRKVGSDKDGDGDIDLDDIRLLSWEDATIVLQNYYWDRWAGDLILNQEVADILVDWVWASGKWGIIIPQRILGVVPDGVVGPMTLAKLNSVNPGIFLYKVYTARVLFLQSLVKHDPTQARFIHGWLRRLNDFI